MLKNREIDYTALVYEYIGEGDNDKEVIDKSLEFFRDAGFSHTCMGGSYQQNNVNGSSFTLPTASLNGTLYSMAQMVGGVLGNDAAGHQRGFDHGESAGGCAYDSCHWKGASFRG